MTQPPNYIHNQYKINLRHGNGQIDTPTEEAITHAAWLGREVTNMGLPTTSVLDAGCRTGYALPVLSKSFDRVVGCDIVPEFVAIASTRGDAIEADLHSLSFKDQEFDWVMCTGTIEHCYDIDKAASELFRVAKVGVFILTDMQSQEEFDRNPSHYVRHDTPEEWITVFKREGWHLVSLAVPSRTFFHGLWLRPEYMQQLNRGLSWYL